MEVIAELYHILKKDGELIISVDSFSGFSSTIIESHRRKFFVQKYFEKNDLEDLLRNLGFSNVEVKLIFRSEFAKYWFNRVANSPTEKFNHWRRLYSIYIYFKISWCERNVSFSKPGAF
jgi:hypothetical protein